MLHILLLLIACTTIYTHPMLVSATGLRSSILASSVAAHVLHTTQTPIMPCRSLWSPCEPTEAPCSPQQLMRVLHAWIPYSTEARTNYVSLQSGRKIINEVNQAESTLIRLIKPAHIKEIVKCEDAMLLTYILASGVNCDIAGRNSPLHESLYHPTPTILKILLSAHVNANVHNEYQQVPLRILAKYASAACSDFERMRMLLLKTLLLTQAGALVSKIKGPLPNLSRGQEFSDLLSYTNILQTSSNADDRQHAEHGIDFIKQEYFIEPADLILTSDGTTPRLVEE